MLAVGHLFYGYYYTNVYKIYGTEYINDDQFLTRVGATAALFNGFFKFIWSYSLDFYSFKRIYGFLIVLEICLIVLVNYAVYNKYAFMVVTWLTFMCDGSLTSMLPAVTVGQFGIKRGPQVYTIMYSCFGVSAILGLLFNTYLKDRIGFTGMFIVSGCFSLTAAIMTWVLKEDKKFDYTSAYNAQKGPKTVTQNVKTIEL